MRHGGGDWIPGIIIGEVTMVVVVVVVVNVVDGDMNRSVTIVMLRSGGNKRQAWGHRFAKRSAPKSRVERQDEEPVKQHYYRESNPFG